MPNHPLLRNAVTPAPISSVTQLIQDRAKQNSPTLSFEFFPPKDEAGETTLWRTFDEVRAAGADFVSVTYGAGGSNSDRTLNIVEKMAPQITTVGHLTAVGATKAGAKDTIRRFEDAGVKSLLAIRGDSPKDNPNALAEGELKTALELVELAREFSSLEIGVGAFPEVHPESPNMQHDAKVLALKQSAGASYAITQLFFSFDAYLALREKADAAGASLPILPGLMPINNAKQVIRMAAMSGASIPANLLAQLEAADEAEARQIGMDFTIELGVKLLAAGAPGLHIFTLNQSTAALELASGIGLCAQKSR
jgi:methylenetetrahydrofolate reductase (NADPH)